MPVAAEERGPVSGEELSNSSLFAQPIKILVFIEAIFIRGAAKTLLTFLDALQSVQEVDGLPSFSFSVATFHRRRFADDSAPPTEFIAALRNRGIKTYIICERHRWDTRVFSSIRAIVNEADPDIVQTNNVKSHALIKASGIHHARCWIAFQHGYTSTDFKMKFYNQLDCWSLRSAKRVIVPCGAFRRQLFSCGVEQQRTCVLPNAGTAIPAPPTRDIEALRTRFVFDPDAKILLTIGRMSCEKGHIDLVQAMNILSHKHAGLKCRLVLLGFGPELPKLRTAVERLGLCSRVVFATNEKDVVPFLHLADVFVLPSRSEGCPHVVLEAMGAGLPIVATSVGGVPEILADGETAMLVEPRRPESLAAGLARLLLSPSLGREYAQKARKVLQTTFSPETYVRGLLSIYQEVLSPSRKLQPSRTETPPQALKTASYGSAPPQRGRS